MTTEIIDGCGCCAECDEVDSWRLEVEYDRTDTGAQTHPRRQTLLHLYHNNGSNTVDLGALGYEIMPDPIDSSYSSTPYIATIASDIVVQMPTSGWSDAGHGTLCDEFTIPAGQYTMTYQAAAKAAYQSFYSVIFYP